MGKSYLLYLNVSVSIVNELEVGFFTCIFFDSFRFDLNPFECPLSVGLPAVFFVNTAFEKQFTVNGHSVVFDNLINIAEVLKSFAESSIAAIQIIIDAIDDIVELFEEIVENLIEFLELFDVGLPNLGVWYMGMTSQNGSQAFPNAIRNAQGGPGDDLKISAGLCFAARRKSGSQLDPARSCLLQLLIQQHKLCRFFKR